MFSVSCEQPKEIQVGIQPWLHHTPSVSLAQQNKGKAESVRLSSPSLESPEAREVASLPRYISRDRNDTFVFPYWWCRALLSLPTRSPLGKQGRRLPGWDLSEKALFPWLKR